jgi:ABC-2 type transport system permease protein
VSDLSGTWTLVRFIGHRDRVRLFVWIASIVVLVTVTVPSIKALFPTQDDLDKAAIASAGNDGVIVFNGPVQGLDTVGGQVAFQVGTATLVLVALMSLFMVTRCTRAEEESGRTELLRATPLGRHAEIGAALVVAASMNLLVGGLVVAVLIGQRLPAGGSLVFGASSVALGMFFVAVALTTAQVTENTSVASGLACAVLGAAFMLRALGDVGDGRLSWLSPIGWSQKTRPFAGDQWWPLLVPLVFIVVFLYLARTLSARRDIGAGLVQSRSGPARASRNLGSPLGLAVRLGRGTAATWVAAMFIIGLAFGSVANAISGFVGNSQGMKEFIARMGGTTLVDAYLGTAVFMLAIIAAFYGVQSVQGLRSEERLLHAEQLLSTRTSRPAWVGGHVVVALVGSVLVLLAAGLGAALPYAILTQDAGQVPRIVGAMLVYLPAVWLLVGLAVALFGLLPQAMGAAWAAMAAFFVVGFFGELLKVPAWVNDLSPFQQTPHLPAAPLTVLPLVVIVLLGVALLSIGILAFGRRDLG